MEKSCTNCGTSGCDHKDARACASGRGKYWTPEKKDLIERLLDAAALPNGLYAEAAAELKRLRAEVEEQCRLLGCGSEREAKLKSENDALRAELAAAQLSITFTEQQLSDAIAGRDKLDAELAALKQQPAQVPEGWQLVPKEPTREMLEAGEETFVPTYTGTCVSSPSAVWDAMISAAQQQEGK